VAKFIDDDLRYKNFTAVINQRFNKIGTVTNVPACWVISTAMSKVKDEIRIENYSGREIAFGQLPKTKEIWGQSGIPLLSLSDWHHWPWTYPLIVQRLWSSYWFLSLFWSFWPLLALGTILAFTKSITLPDNFSIWIIHSPQSKLYKRLYKKLYNLSKLYHILT